MENIMKTKIYLKIKIIVLSVISLFYFSGCTVQEQVVVAVDSRPNIILIMADDLGYETLTCNGGASYKTPNIDKMATEGMRFEHCYAQPICTPSRVKIMTGIYNIRNYVEFGKLDTSQTTFGHLFQDAAYATCVVGKWQLGRDPMSPHKAGFDEYCLWQVSHGRIDTITKRDTRFSEPILETNGVLKTFDKTDFGPEIVSNYGLDFIERSVKKKKAFLLYYPMILTHCPFSPTPDSPEWLNDTTAVMKYKGKADYFEDMLSYTDKLIGNINQKLVDLGIEDNTLIIFTGDNGTDKPIESFFNDRVIAGAKGKSTDAGTRVPFVAKWPNTIKANTVSTDLIDFSDVLPTICQAAKIRYSSELDGQSFLAQLKGQKGQARQWVYNWYSRNGEAEKASVFARNQRYKLYANGSLFDVPNDYLESKPIDITQLTGQAKTDYEMLKHVLDSYQDRRLDAITKL